MSEYRLVLKTGHKGEDVRILQELLGMKNADGVFGKVTREEVIKFQRTFNLTPDGIVGPMTWKVLNFNPQEIHADTDEITSATWIERYHLPEGEYVHQSTSKKYIFIHHTAGRHNPYKTIDNWANDSRGRIGTNYVIGGIPTDADMNAITAVQKKYDGRVLQAIDDEFWGYHLGPNGSSFMTKHSLSIELNSAGGLTKRGDKYYTWFNTEVHPSQVQTLDEPFRGYKYFHKYSKAQIQSLEALLYHLAEKHDINLQDGMHKMPYEQRYEFNENAWSGKVTGLLSHTNVRKDKSDVFPQPELNAMIESLRF